jgi:hypothetical protein
LSVLTFLFRWRVIVVSVLAAGAAGLAAVTLHDFEIPVGALFLAGISFVAGSAVAYAHLRHLGLAMVSVLAPLPGMMAVAPFVTALSNTTVLSVYGLGSAGASLLAGDIVRRVLEGKAPVDAARDALARFAAAVGVTCVAGAALLVGWLFRDARALGLEASAIMLAALLSGSVLVPFAAAVMPFSESFFTAANRAREGRERWLRIAADVVKPRWGLSVTGVTLVFAVLGWYGAAPMLGRSALLMQPALWAASALGLSIALLWIGRDARGAAAALLAFATVSLVDLWLWGRAVGHLTAPAFVVIVMTVLSALLIVLMLIGRQRDYRRGGDEAAVARLRAIEELGTAPWFAGAGAAAAVVPWISVHGAMATLAVLFLDAAAVALLAVPAVTTAIETVLPRRRSVDELYGRR